MEQQAKRPSNPLFTIFLIVLAVCLILSFATRKKLADVSYSQVLQLFEEESVQAFDLTADGLLTLTLHAPLDGQDTLLIQIGDVDQFHQDLDPLIARQKTAGILESYNYLPPDDSVELGDVLPYLFMAFMLIVVLVVIIRRTGGNNPAQYLQVNALVGKVKVTFADVAGAEEEKEELRDVVEFLRDPQKFTRLGARIPKGILLEGPPGTGKTLLARAVAGEAGVQFFSITGSDFVEMFVGVGAGRVRNLFDQARKAAPSIVFIDEVDAVGRRRGSGLGGGHDEREQTLNQLLVEIDGFNQNEGIIVMAATNRKDILDPALLRPGRFDRQIYVGRPDRRARMEILKVHTRNKPLDETVDLDAIAGVTAGFTGADLENLTNEAALMAAKADQKVVTRENMDEAMMKVIAGPAKRSRVIPQAERRLTAIHEAGHAVAMHHLPTHDPVRQITIIPRGSTGGTTWSQPQDDRSYMSRKQMYELIVSYLGGRVAEELFLDDVSTGAGHDIRQATELARDMVSKYGMSRRLGTVSYGSDGEVFVGRDYRESKSYSEKFAGEIDEEVKAIVDEAYAHCTKLLTDHRTQVQQVADRLLEQETLDREAFEAIMQAAE